MLANVHGISTLCDELATNRIPPGGSVKRSLALAALSVRGTIAKAFGLDAATRHRALPSRAEAASLDAFGKPRLDIKYFNYGDGK